MNLVSVSESSRLSRRAVTRREVLIPIQAVREHDFVLVADRTIDISVEGMLLPTLGEHRVFTGDQLILSFRIPGMWIDAEATVTRVIHGRRPSDDGLAFGVLFDVMSPSSRAALAGFLHGRPPPLPRRGPLARMRRGLDAPQLADAALMQASLCPIAYASELDVEAVGEEDSEPFDPLGILTEVAASWRRLVEPH